MTYPLAFYAVFTASKAGVDSLTVTWDIEQIARADGTRTALVTGGATSITIGRRGLYGYLLSGADLSLYDYIATAITTDTGVDSKEVPAVWSNFAMPSVAQTGDAYARLGSPEGESVSADIAVIYGNVSSILEDTGTDGVVLADDAITSDKFDESTAFPQTAADIAPMVLP